MGTVYRKTFTKPLPAGAELFVRKGERFARFKDAKGRSRTEAVTTGTDGADRLLIVAGTYTAKYRDGSGVVREVATGCRDKTAAESVLGELERRAELVKAGVMTSGENSVADHQSTPLSTHFATYLEHHEAKGTCDEHRTNVRRMLNRLATDCGLNRLADLAREPIERWLGVQLKAKMGARTRNTYLAAAIAFANWAVETGRLVGNPFMAIARADEKSDPRRQRRALTEAELVKLLEVARRRPLVEGMTVRRGKRAGQVVAKLSDATRENLDRLGRERELIYKTLVLTGLRKGELASLTVGQVVLDTEVPYFLLHAADEKNRQGADVPLRSDLIADLQSWLDEKLAVARVEAFRRGQLVPERLPSSTPLFNVPDKLVKILNRDLTAAGIAKRDERGRTVDVHALRHSFGTLLSKAGVAPRTAQAAMRHSKIDLTMNTYTDPKLLDVSGAMESLPSLPLGGEHKNIRQAAKATGTDDYQPSPLAPPLAPTHVQSSASESFTVKMTEPTRHRNEPAENRVSAYRDKRKHPQTTTVNGCLKVETTGVEPVTPSLQSWCSPN